MERIIYIWLTVWVDFQRVEENKEEEWRKRSKHLKLGDLSKI